MKKKLIEVALPLEAINKASAREKSIRHGPPEHAAPVVGAAAAGGGAGGDLRADGGRPVGLRGRAPGGPEAAPQGGERAQGPAEAVGGGPSPRRRRPKGPGFRSRNQVRRRPSTTCWPTRSASGSSASSRTWCCGRTPPTRRCCRRRATRSGRAGGAPAPRTPTIRARRSCSTGTKLPAFHDPFAGGGALPLEAQRLGLESYASDLNPVAVLINKAMIEIPPKFAGKPPVNPEARKDKTLIARGVAGRAGPRRGRALLRPVDARRGREAHRPPLPEGRGHRRDGEGAAGPEAATSARSSP